MPHEIHMHVHGPVEMHMHGRISVHMHPPKSDGLTAAEEADVLERLKDEAAKLSPLATDAPSGTPESPAS
jgi:hypothetical protein